ncbi:uncharacterized protein LOC128952969 [Oppia nitens]|uniref:uncharacterized protein LOC128952969 n=1 Tax=Oppia nitens TaxID=1686743 RepID=UPI0023DABBBE|nr:uncharacterized protein LOC128952969 [Oppia nitens]
MSLSESQKAFEELVSRMSSHDLPNFYQWIQSTYLTSDSLDDRPTEAYVTLNRIANDIKLMVPMSGVIPSEPMTFPTLGQNSDCNALNTISLDAFLYDDLDIEDMTDEGLLERYYCCDCLSRNIQSLNLISHSASKKRVEFIYNGLLKDIDFSNKTILDIGSRLGSILYGAYVYTNCKHIIGVEMNEELCLIQNKIIEKYQMNDRINVICNDISSLPQIVRSADIIVMNNVFEFFLNDSKQTDCWMFLYNHIKSDTYLITVPTLEDSLNHLSQVTIDLSKWVSKVDIKDSVLSTSKADHEEMSDICLYRII